MSSDIPLIADAAVAEPQGAAAPAPRVRVPRRPVHGVLMLDKPLGLSSNDALQKVKRLFRAEKAGHTGTLDPLATGLLPICFGAATKFSQVSLEADKGDRATLPGGEVVALGAEYAPQSGQVQIGIRPEHAMLTATGGLPITIRR